MTESVVRSDHGADGSFAAGSTMRRGWTLVVACGGVALVVASMVALNTALADIAAATSASQTQLTWIVDSYTLLLACLLLPAGAIGDRYGRRTALLVGLAIFAGASAAPLFFDSPVQIIAARAVAGAGAAFVMPATLSLLTVAYPPEARTKALGIWAGVAGSGGVFGLLGTGLLLHFWAWQSIFWTFAVVGLALFVLTLTIAESRKHDAPPVDWLGAVTIGAAVAVFVSASCRPPNTAGPTRACTAAWLSASFSRWCSGSSNCTAANPCWMSGCSWTPASSPVRPRSRWCSSAPSPSFTLSRSSFSR